MPCNRFMAVGLGMFILSLSAGADETPNLMPGLWVYSHTTHIEGPMAIAPQTATSQHCITQADIDKGLDVIDLPESCQLTRVEIQRNRADYAAECNLQGIPGRFSGYAIFDGKQMQGEMNSEIETPLGKMLMKMDYQAKRQGEC